MSNFSRRSVLISLPVLIMFAGDNHGARRLRRKQQGKYWQNSKRA